MQIKCIKGQINAKKYPGFRLQMWVKHQKRLSSTVPLMQPSIFFHYETL